MWYNEQQQTRGNVITFPSGQKIDASNKDESPINGWHWHDEPPQWWIDLQETEQEEP